MIGSLAPLPSRLLHPVVRCLLLFVLLGLCTFHTRSAFFSLALAGVAGVGLWLIPRPGRSIGKHLRGIAFLLLFVAGLPLLRAGFAGISTAFDAVLRVVAIVLTSVLFFSTIRPEELFYALERILRPLPLSRRAARSFCFSLSIGLRFVPLFFEELERVRLSQISRGVRLNSSSLSFLQGPRVYMALLIPVLFLAFRKAETLATAMESRGFHLDQPRSSYRQYSWGITDVLAVLMLAILAFAALFPASFPFL
jgi:energy-coupling factor transport system permease protein